MDSLDTNFRGWRRVWGEPGENRGGTGGEPGAPKRTGGEPGAFGKRTGGEPGAFGALGQEPGENRGEGIFFEKRPNSGPENQRTGPPVKISIAGVARVHRITDLHREIWPA